MKRIALVIFTVCLFSACMSKPLPEDDGNASLEINDTPNAVITVDTNTRYQYVRGFGGMDVGWANFPLTTSRDTELMYNPDTGLGLNILRIMIMPWNTNIGAMMGRLTGGDRPYYYENVKIVNKYGGYVIASPWSPPAEWKNNNSTRGDGKLLSEYYQAYADYLRSFASHMYEKGAPVYAVSIQNEPNYKVTYDGCLWSSDEMRDFFRQTGRFTTGVKGFGGGAEIPNVLVMTGESFNNPNINNAALNDAAARQAIDIVGRHTYGNFRKYRYANALDHPTDPKEVWMTEHNINSGSESLYPLDSTWNYVWKFINDIDLSIRLTDESAFIWWAAKRFYSFMGDGRYGTRESVIQPRGYGISHYAKFAKETWRVAVSASGKTARGQNITNSNFNSAVDDVNGTDVKATAFVSPDGNTISLVLFTPTTPAGGDGINMGTVEIRLPGDFIIREAAAMRSRRDNYAVWEDVHINEDRTSALVALPAGNILSLRFTK